MRGQASSRQTLYGMAIVEMPQVFLSVATDAKGQTLYEKRVVGKYWLGEVISVTETVQRMG